MLSTTMACNTKKLDYLTIFREWRTKESESGERERRGRWMKAEK